VPRASPRAATGPLSSAVRAIERPRAGSTKLAEDCSSGSNDWHLLGKRADDWAEQLMPFSRKSQVGAVAGSVLVVVGLCLWAIPLFAPKTFGVSGV
jgi:hypothetical protein